MSTLSSHVLDLTAGRPAARVPITLARRSSDGSHRQLAATESDADGRLREPFPSNLEEGVYRLLFDTAAYFSAHGTEALYPEISVVVRIAGAEHYHVALLLGPYGYTTYRGS